MKTAEDVTKEICMGIFYAYSPDSPESMLIKAAIEEYGNGIIADCMIASAVI